MKLIILYLEHRAKKRKIGDFWQGISRVGRVKGECERGMNVTEVPHLHA
jgi:hypothetical protein